jgi:hypothetical protein
MEVIFHIPYEIWNMEYDLPPDWLLP